MSDDNFQRTAANQNIDPECVKMVEGISEDLLGRYEGKHPLSESAEVEFYVNLYWQAHYQNVIGECLLCDHLGMICDNFGRKKYYCICPEGMKRRKEENER